MPKIEAGMRERIAEFLPKALETAVASYTSFSQEETSASGDKKATTDKAKTFKAHHDACKVALAHIELLMKLVKLADLPEPALSSALKQEELRVLIESGQAELKGMT